MNRFIVLRAAVILAIFGGMTPQVHAIVVDEKPYKYQMLLSTEEYSSLPDTIKYEYLMELYKATEQLNGENSKALGLGSFFQMILNSISEISRADEGDIYLTPAELKHLENMKRTMTDDNSTLTNQRKLYQLEAERIRKSLLRQLMRDLRKVKIFALSGKEEKIRNKLVRETTQRKLED
jgi:hypothetical protein